MASIRKTNPSDVPARSSNAEVDAFLRKVASTPRRRADLPRGRLLFALDATASREPTWDRACHLQAEMFQGAAALGGLDIQLCSYRGYQEFEASPWCHRSEDLLAYMARVRCVGGMTQIERVLDHVIAETKRARVNALVFVGDCMEEDIDRLCDRAGKLGLLGVPAFVFHEGHDRVAARSFQEIARLSGGAYCHFDASSPQQLRDLLRAVAAYAAGGRQALADLGKREGGVAHQLEHQLKGG
ncbi:MAG: VWA domain-containing protein [Gammaproteobacteria bacterium]